MDRLSLAARKSSYTDVAESEFSSPLVVYFEAGRAQSSSETGVHANQGRVTTNIKSWSITSDYMVSADGFEFVLYDEDPDNLRDLEGLPVLLVVNGATQLIGRIDMTTRGDDGISVTCQGRDYVADLVECNIDPTFVIKEGETLGDVILRACKPIGITAIDPDSATEVVLDVRKGVPGKTKRHRGKKTEGGNKSKPPHELTLQDLKPDIGQGIYEFLKPICDRHDCTIQPSTLRDTLLIAGPLMAQDPSFMLVRSRSDGSNNNIKSGTVSRDYSSFPTLTIVQGQGAPRAGETTSSAVQIVDTWAQAQRLGGELAQTLDSITWNGRRKNDDTTPIPIDKIYRLNIFRDDKARSPDQITKAAKRLFYEHLKKTLEYHVTVKGHVDPVSGAVWTINTICRVDDDVCDIHENLWIQSRTLKYSPGSGGTTDLVLIRPDTFDFLPDIAPVANAGDGKRRVQAADRFYNPQDYKGGPGGPPALIDPLPDFFNSPSLDPFRLPSLDTIGKPI